MKSRSIRQIPLPGNSGIAPTGAIQFQDDWPGLFVRGDDAMALMSSINHLRKRLADHPDVAVASALLTLSKYADLIDRDVIVRGESNPEPGPATERDGKG